jgi:hypothetical protein
MNSVSNGDIRYLQTYFIETREPGGREAGKYEIWLCEPPLEDSIGADLRPIIFFSTQSEDYRRLNLNR